MTVAVDMIYYLRCQDIDDRNVIAQALDRAGYSWLEMTGGQAAYQSIEPAIHNFELFRMIVLAEALHHSIMVLEIRYTQDPGLGLFNIFLN